MAWKSCCRWKYNHRKLDRPREHRALYCPAVRGLKAPRQLGAAGLNAVLCPHAKAGGGPARLSPRPAKAQDPRGSTLSRRSWVTLTKGPFSSLAAPDLQIQSRRPGVYRGGGKEPPPAHKSCLQDFLRVWVCGSEVSFPRRPPETALHPQTGQGAGRLLRPQAGLGLPWVGALRVRSRTPCSLPTGPDARALLSLALQDKEPHPPPSLHSTEFGPVTASPPGGRGSRVPRPRAEEVHNPLSLGRQRKTWDPPGSDKPTWPSQDSPPIPQRPT